MVTVQISPSGFVDLEAPIHMTEAQREEFIGFFEKHFPGQLKTEERAEARKTYGEREAKPKEWTVEEYVKLADPSLTNDQLMRELGRSEMSIQMKRGHFVPDFMAWLKRRGLKFDGQDRLVRDFMKEWGGDA